MKLTISSQQREYFETSQVLELEGLFSHADVFSLFENIELVLSERLKCPLEQIRKESPEKLFDAGRDIWRANNVVRKLITSPRLCSLPSILLEEKPVRLAYDIYIEPTNANFLSPTRPFAEICCIQGVIGGMCICLEGEKEGNIKVFSRDYEIDPMQMFAGKPFLMVVYSRASSLFLRKLEDPMTVPFRALGYRYGDRLLGTINPIVFK